ncbi:U3 snoRNP protein [Physocladia obscura]|uniref:U3 snoRNP protein n=1 Tax=Physocladia obscura TaxID=109957 RepID=A0AAD5T9I7_9FUNG|nr:U3 snoRNP protein [Physocladia obscura]
MKDHRSYIRQFGAEAFGFIIRKVPHEKLPAFLKFVIKSLQKDTSEAYSEGIALLLFETLKQVRHTLHSRAIPILRVFVDLIQENFSDSNNNAFDTLIKAITAIGHHLTPETADEIWEYSINSVTKHLGSYKNPENEANHEHFRKTFKVFATLVLLRKGSRICDRKAIYGVIEHILDVVVVKYNVDDSLALDVIECLASLTAFSNLENILLTGKAAVSKLFGSKNARYIFVFCDILRKLKSDHLAKFIMPQLVEFLPFAWATNSNMANMFLADLVDSNFESQLSFVAHDLKTPDLCLKLPKQVVFEYSKSLDTIVLDVEKIDNWANEIDCIVSENDGKSCSKLASLIVLLSSAKIISTPLSDLFDKLRSLIQAVLKAAPQVTGKYDGEYGSINRRACMSLIIQRVSETLVSRAVRAKDVKRLVTELFDTIVGEYLNEFFNDVQCLETVAAFVEASESFSTLVLFNQEQYCKILLTLVPNIGSVNPVVRSCSLRVIIGLAKYIGNQDIRIFEAAFECEQIEDSLEKYREKSLLIKKMENMIEAKAVNKVNEEAAIRYSLALLSCKFSMIHSDASSLLISLAKHSSDLFWKYYFPILLKTKSQGHDPVDFQIKFPEFNSAIDLERKGVTTICTAINKIHSISERTNSIFQNLNEYERLAFFKSTKDTIERLDDQHFYIILIKLLRNLPSLVEQKSTQILPLYFELLLRTDSGTEEHVEESEDTGVKNDAVSSTAEQIETSSIRGIVLEFLHVFENLNKPHTVHEPSKLYDSFLDLLSNGDAKIQLLALNCILKWNQPGVTQYGEHLKGLADDSKFRDFLSSLQVDELRNNVKIEDQTALMHILLRILYGKLISRRGRGSSKVGLKARRNAIFAFMVSLNDIDREFFIDLMVAPFQSILKLDSLGESMSDGTFSFVKDLVDSAVTSPIKFQVGFMNILEDSIKQLKNLISPVLPKIMTVVMYLMNAAEQELLKIDKKPVINEPESDDLTDSVRVKQLKDIRHTAMLRLAQLFNSIDNFDFGPYVPAIFVSIIDSRIEKFDTENTQSSSALMDILVSWSKKKNYALYLAHRRSLMPKVLAVLAANNVQESVISIVVAIFESFLELDERFESGEICAALVKPNMGPILKNFGILLEKLLQQSVQRFSTISLISRVIRVLAQTSSFVNNPIEAENLMAILTPCLRKRSQAVSEKLKVDILEILSNYIPVLPSLQDPETRMQAPYFTVISQMFSTLTERGSRLKAVQAFKNFAKIESKLQLIVEIVEKFNSYLKHRLEDPDFNLRFDAFTEIGQTLYKSMDSEQWLPILHSLIFSLQDQTEFSIRTSAAFCLSKFVEIASGQIQPDASIKNEEIAKMKNQVIHVLFPAIKNGISSNVELVRSEFMNLLGIIVKNFGNLDEFKDMVILLAADDDEASFFSNVYHMQVHRRIRALKRLAEIAATGVLSQSNVSNIFLPLVTHIIFEANRQSDHNIMNEAISTIAACSGCLSWGKYYGIIKNFLKAIPKRPLLEKELIRVVVAILENFKFKMMAHSLVETEATVPSIRKSAEAEFELSSMEVDSDGDDNAIKVDMPTGNTAQMQRIHNTVCKKLIPDLFAYLTKEDDENVNLRVPVAVAITKLLTKLPKDSMNIELPRLLTTVCQFLKNRLQDVRDGCREALIKIAKELGPVYFPFIIKELQGALLRGYQLHVLGYSVHHLLVGVTDSFGDNGYDTSIEMLVRIFVNDIFGSVSDEREVLEMNGKLKEIKRTKSFDSFELVAKTVKMNKITSLLLPLKELMLESNSSKTVNKIQDILRRIVSGLSANTSLAETDLLVFVHGLITETLPLSKLVSTPKQKRSVAEKRITVQMKRNEPLNDMLTYFKANAYLFIDFGLSILLVTIKKDGVRPNNPDHLKMMDPLIEVLSKSLYSTHNTVVVNSLKIFVYLVKWPLPSLEVSVPVILNRIFDLFMKKGDASSDKSDASLKLLSAIIKDCPSMAVVSKIMVTSQSNHVRDLCRQCHCQFLLEYPHGPLRLKKEFTYLLQNLKYEFDTGRESVLSFFALLIPKLSEDVLNEFAEMILLSFVMVLINDDTSKCREKASDLIKLLIRQVSLAKRDTFVNLMNGWFKQTEQPQILRTAAQLLGLYVEAVSERDARPIIEKMISHLLIVLKVVRDEHERLAYDNNEDNDPANDEEMKLQYWQAGYNALNALTKFFAKSVTVKFILGTDCLELWPMLKYLLLYPHNWIRSISCRIFGILFAAIDLENLDESNETVKAILLDPREISFVSMQMTKQLESPLLQEDQAKQVVKNLLFLGKFVLKFHKITEKDSETEDGDGKDDNIDSGNPILVKIFKRMAYIGRADLGTPKVLLRKTVFQWFGAMILSMKVGNYTPYVAPAMSVLYRTINSVGQDPEELKVLGKEIAEHMQNAIGISEYLEIYNKVHNTVQDVRQERKVKRKIQAVADPEASAKRREQKNVMKKAGKKRKAEEFSKSRIRIGMSKRARGLNME